MRGGGKSLAEAYAAGELAIYSRENNGIIKDSNKRSGFKNWDGRPVLDLKKMNAGYDNWGDVSVAWLMYNQKTDSVSVVAGKFAQKYENGEAGKIGVALADSFIVYDNGESGDHTAYQNFSNGYFKSRNGGDCEVVLAKSAVLKAGVASGTTQADWVEETDVSANSAGYVGAATADIVRASGLSGAAFAKLYEDAYNRYAAADINVGYAFGMVENNFGTVSQNFRHGDSTASPWDSGKPNGDRARWSILSFNVELTEVFLIKDEFFYVRENGGNKQSDARSLGAPTGEEFTFDGNRYQNYVGGYIKAAGETPQNANAAEVVKGKKIDADGTVADISLSDKIGYVSNGVAIPEKYTKESFGQLFIDKYEAVLKDFDLKALSIVQLKNNVILQDYTDGKGDNVAIAYDKVNDAVRYMSVGAYASFKDAVGLGCPTTESFKVAEGSDKLPAVYAQGFENGYIKIKVTKQSDLDDDGNVIEFTKEIGTMTVGATYDAEKETFVTTNYAEDINNVDKSVANAYENLEVPANDVLIAMFKETYNKAFAIGFSAGKPSDEGILWWTTGQSGIVKLTLKGGNGNANFWGDNTLMAYDCDNKVVRITTSTIANIYASEGASGNGWPTTEMMINTKTGTIVQQFNITDPVVTDRKVYIIVPNGAVAQASKVSGEYDFAANKGEGEWVEYLTQFGGDSVSAKPVQVEETYKKGEQLTIDFSKFVGNDAKYSVKYELAAGTPGSINAATGVYTYTPDAAGNKEIEILVYTAFDKLSLKATLKVEGEEPTPGPEPTPTGCGCSTFGAGGTGGIIGGIGGVLLLGATLLFVIRRKSARKTKA